MGHLLDVIRYKNKCQSDEFSVLHLLCRWSEQVGTPIFVVFFIQQPSVITTDAESVKTIIMNPENGKDSTSMKLLVNLMGERYLGRSIFAITDYKTWKPRRQVYDPAFKKSYLQTLLEPFNEKANEFINNLRPMADGKTRVPMKTQFGTYTLETISKVAFGTDFAEVLNDQKDSLDGSKANNTSLIFLVDFTFKGVGLALWNPGFRFFHPLEAAKYRQASRDIRALGRDCIKKRIQLIESGASAPNDILTHILQVIASKESVDIEELVDDFVTFYVGGQDTTQNLLTFALALTLLDQNVHERVQAEVDEVLGNKDRVDAADLEKLNYIEQVFKETLRLYGPLVAINKEAAAGGVVLNGYKIPGGTQIMLPSAVMCRKPEYFDDPYTFNPSRFDPKNKRPNSFVYFPFGVGHRSCIGKHFAMMEAKIAFSRLFQTYKIRLPDNYELVAVQRGTVQTKDDVHCYLECRQN